MASQSQTKENWEIIHSTAHAKQRVDLVEWLNGMLPDLRLPLEASEEEIRACLIDGTVLCSVLDRLKPGSINEWGGSDHSSEACVENVKRFLSAMDQMGLPKFRILDLEQGSMDTVVECLLSLKKHYNSNSGGENVHITSSMAKSGTQPRKRWKLLEVESSEGIDGSCGVSPGAQNTPVTREERRKSWTDSKFQRVLRSPVMSEPSAALIHHVGHKFQEVFQLKQGRYADIPAAKISEIMKSNSLDNAPTQSLLSVVNGILDESVERKNGEIPHRVACLLRKVVQEIERRIATQAEHLRTQNNLYKAREEKYQSRLRVLETLATGTSEETQVATNKFQHIKMEKTKMEEKKKLEEQDMVKLTKEKDHSDLEISTLKQELELAKQKYEQRCLQLETQAKGTTVELEVKLKELENQRCQQLARLTKEKDHSDLEISTLKQELELAKQKYEQRCLQLETQAMGTTVELEVKLKELEDQRCQQLARLTKEKDHSDLEISTLKQELELAKQKYEQHCLQLETQAMGTTVELEVKLKELEGILEDSRKNVEELKSFSESKAQIWNKKEHSYQNFVDLQFKSLQELRFTSQSIKQVVLHTQRLYSEEFSRLGVKLKGLADVAENYHMVLAENRKLYNEVQDLKGNIRVYCRIRPFLPGQNGKQTTIDFIGENGEMIIVNPLKQGKDSRRPFKFNKVYGPTATQEQVFLDTQPLVRSILDGYNVCIFAYGQTGSGKTYTMNGPDGASKEEWGVNFRALNDLFNISESRRNSFVYEIGVQIVEIYNEQVRDLLASDSSQKKLGILSTAQPNGLAVPDATMQPVKSTGDVLRLMRIGLTNRAVGSTAMNERSSRSHSVLTVHVRGTDLATGAIFRGNLHLVDLAGSERVDRSEVVGDRLREAQHINKSLSALGDVIFALAQKSPHVPYRNSKLTQVLQSSLGGQAKTLMFVQLNPDADSYSESLSTLKFAERVSGIELGAARSNKEGKDVRELMEQVASLKDTIAKKDEEIERLQLLKDHRPVSPAANDAGQNSSADLELLGSGDADSEDRLSDISDGGLSMGTETDGSISSAVESTLFPEGAKPDEGIEKSKPSPSKLSKPAQKQVQTGSIRRSSSKETLKVSTSSKNISTSGSSSAAKLIKKFQQT